MSNFFHYLFKPSPHIHDRIRIRNAKLFLGLSFFRSIGLLFLFFQMMSLPHTKEAEIGVGLTLFLSLASYFIARTKHFEKGVWLISIHIWLAVPMIIKNVQDFEAIGSGMWLGLTPIIAGLVLPFKQAVLMGIITVISHVVTLHFHQPEHLSLAGTMFIYVVSSTILVLVATYIRDQSDRDLDQERAKLAHSSKLAALGEMAAGIAHEINSPLAAISMNCQMISKKISSFAELEKQSEKLSQVVQTCQRISKIVEGLKDFARADKNLELKNFPVSSSFEALSNLANSKAKSLGIELKFFYEKNPLIFANEIQLTQVLMNLLNNSFHAIESSNDPWVKIVASELENEIAIDVIDSGSGIDSNIVDKIFDPFFTTKDYGQGTGLGLSVSKGILESMNAKIEYVKNQNTTFRILFLKNETNLEKGKNVA